MPKATSGDFPLREVIITDDNAGGEAQVPSARCCGGRWRTVAPQDIANWDPHHGRSSRSTRTVKFEHVRKARPSPRDRRRHGLSTLV